MCMCKIVYMIHLKAGAVHALNIMSVLDTLVTHNVCNIAQFMCVLFTLVIPPCLLSVNFTLAGVCTLHVEQIHIHAYFTLYEVTVGRSDSIRSDTIQSDSVCNDTDTYTPPIHFGCNKRCLWGQRNVYI